VVGRSGGRNEEHGRAGGGRRAEQSPQGLTTLNEYAAALASLLSNLSIART
jgi:hypothetical protein